MAFEPDYRNYDDGFKDGLDIGKEKYAVAVKALISPASPGLGDVEEILVLKNALDDPHRPGAPDFPGGRLNPNEDPYAGLKRELEEELGQEFADAVTIGWPLDVAHFKRPDDQVVTMIFFHCILNEDKPIVLSAEHSGYEWASLENEHAVQGKMKRAFERLAGRDKFPYEDEV